jgi:hypothetical protein
MASEEQPPNVHEGGADAAKASAALSSLDRNNDDDESSPNKGADAEALGKAMQNLDVKEEKKSVTKVKVEAADVALLVSLVRGLGGLRREANGCD